MQQGLPVDQMDQVVADTFYSPMNNGICESDFFIKNKGSFLINRGDSTTILAIFSPWIILPDSKGNWGLQRISAVPKVTQLLIWKSWE